jgi:putative aldouronate transport system substrate-binding protein
LDYRYSDTGSFLYGYGIEGLTYEYDENGELWITDYIVNHPAYWGMIMCTYALNTIYEPGLEIDYSLRMEINADTPQLLEYWMSTPHDNAYVFPLGVTYTTEQTEQLAQISVDINTYIKENYLAFVDGSKPLSEWGEYVQTLSEIGVQTVLDIHQAAYEAYIA